MDSLLANYASSDDDDGDAEVSRPVPPKVSPSTASVAPPKSSSLFSSLPLPRTSISATSSSPSSSLFSSLPPPRSHLPLHSLNDDLREEGEGNPSRQPPPSSIFSSLPPPKTSSSSSSSSLPANNLPSDQKLKRIVHFTLPLNPSLLKSQDSDDDGNEEEMRRKLKKNDSSSSTSKALSSMLPAPKNSLCIAPAQSSGAASRRSSLQEYIISSPKHAQESKEEQKSESYTNYTNYGTEQGVAAGYYDNYGSYTAEHGVTDYENYTNDSVDLTYNDNPAITPWEQVNGNGVGYGSYMDNLTIVSRGEKQFEGIITGKRGRADIPTEIVEVKQDELMKNRPREDQVKLTGIAFGPAYQAAPSGKGKPTKLHKRKHQIGSLYYDLKQKEMELAERRSKGLLTKAETQAKYGW